MSGSDAVSEAMGDERSDSAIPDAVTSAMEALAPSVASRFGSGNFAVVAGGVSLFRAVRSYRKGKRKRALLRAVVGLFWVGVAVAQHRGRSGGSGPGLSEVARGSTDVTDAADAGERETDHATGEEVVNTTDADIDESDTGPELDGDATEGDVDQRDVAGTDEIDTADEAGEDDESPSADAESETETGTAPDIGIEDDETETGEDAESESAE